MDFLDFIGLIIFMMIFLAPLFKKKPKNLSPEEKAKQEDLLKEFLKAVDINADFEEEEKVMEEAKLPPPLPPVKPPPRKSLRAKQKAREEKFEFHSNLEDRETHSRIEDRQLETKIEERKVVSDYLIEPKPLKTRPYAKRVKGESRLEELLGGLSDHNEMIILHALLQPPKGTVWDERDPQ